VNLGEGTRIGTTRLDKVAWFSLRALVVVAAALGLLWVVGRLRLVLLPIAAALLLAAPLRPLAQRMQRVLGRTGAAVAAVVGLLVVVLGSLTLADVEGAFDRAMATWENAVCSVIPIVEIEDPAGDLGVVEYILSGGTAGADDAYADLTFAGFGTIVDAILGPTTLAATFTFNYIDDDGNDTDLDGNGLLDTAFREIYFVGSWDWNIDDHYDVETVALHEAGHGLSQAHFGMITETEANGKIHFSPRAVMNAAYSGIQQRLGKSDLAGHCTLWADWPNN